MKKIITLLMVTMAILPTKALAEPTIQVNINCNRGIEEMISRLIFNSSGYYDAFGHFHNAIGHHHHYGQTRCNICDHYYREYLKHHRHEMHKKPKKIKHAAKQMHNNDHNRKNFKYNGHKHR